MFVFLKGFVCTTSLYNVAHVNRRVNVEVGMSDRAHLLKERRRFQQCEVIVVAGSKLNPCNNLMGIWLANTHPPSEYPVGMSASVMESPGTRPPAADS